MNIRIVTDSTADVPPQLANDLGIVVVPAYVCFGDCAYRDRVDIGEEDFYQRLLRDPVHPCTEPPTPQDFATVYQKLLAEADGIISLHISSKLSATCNSALRGKELAGKGLPIEVIDSQLVTMGLGLLAIAAAADARHCDSLSQAAEKIREAIPTIRVLGLFNTLKYLARGGRIGRVKALLGSALNVKPMVTMKDGELESAGRANSRAEGINRLASFVRDAADVEDLAVVYSTTPEEAQTLADLVSPVLSRGSVRLVRLGPVLGVHGGPGILFVALRAKA